MAEITNENEIILFKKKLDRLSRFHGTGTELISLYIPPATDRSIVMKQLTAELSQSANIKDPKTRKNVQGALRKIVGFLKRINYKVPANGIAIFAGNVSEYEGRTDIRLFTITPIQRLDTKLYYCNSSFYLNPLVEMIKPTDIYLLVTIDKNEATIAVLKERRYEIIARFRSRVPGKIRAGGQSAKRFEHLRTEAEHDFYKEISEVINKKTIEGIDKIKGLIVAGPGMTKNFFLEEDLLDYRIKQKIVAKIDVGYANESGIKEALDKAHELLKNTDIIREKQLVQRFFSEIVKDGLAVYGEKDTLAALTTGKISELLISEALEKTVYKVRCNNCKNEAIMIGFKYEEQRCKECNSELELIEEIDYIDYLIDEITKIGAGFRIISNETEEGKQFLAGFGGIGAFLRYK